MLNIFWWPSVFLGDMCIQILVHFQNQISFCLFLVLFLLVSDKSSLYILDINTFLYEYVVCKYILPFHELPFILLIDWLAVKKHSSLVWSKIVCFCFCCLYFAIIPKKLPQTLMLWSFSQLSSVISGFTLISFTHFELIFV